MVNDQPLFYLFDDIVARRWAPFTLTRPAGELLLGTMTLRERAEAAVGLPCAGHLTRLALAGFDEPGAAPVAELAAVPQERTRVLLSSRAVPAAPLSLRLDEPASLTMDGTAVGWVLPPGTATPSDEDLRRPFRAPGPGEEVTVEGELLGGPWDLVARNGDWIRRDAASFPARDSAPEGVIRIGEEALLLAEGADVEAGVVVDLRAGPILVDRGARVEGPARLSGPLWIGPDSVVFGGSVGTSSVGPVCKVRGEVADTIILGYTNKAHDGYLGHAVLGRWVNLGAFTTNSDLKNNYGTVRVWTPDGERDTGLMKVGCFLGDHVKTGIGTVLNTGTVVGAGSNVFGGLMPPTVVPPFSWGAGADLRDYRLQKFLEVAERAMARRDQVLTPGVRRVLVEAWNGTRRRRAE